MIVFRKVIIRYLILNNMEIGLELVIICVLFGLLFGIISTVGGIGGGVFYVPFMSLFLMLPIISAVDSY